MVLFRFIFFFLSLYAQVFNSFPALSYLFMNFTTRDSGATNDYKLWRGGPCVRMGTHARTRASFDHRHVSARPNDRHAFGKLTVINGFCSEFV